MSHNTRHAAIAHGDATQKSTWERHTTTVSG